MLAGTSNPPRSYQNEICMGARKMTHISTFCRSSWDFCIPRSLVSNKEVVSAVPRHHLPINAQRPRHIYCCVTAKECDPAQERGRERDRAIPQWNNYYINQHATVEVGNWTEIGRYIGTDEILRRQLKQVYPRRFETCQGQLCLLIASQRASKICLDTTAGFAPAPTP